MTLASTADLRDLATAVAGVATRAGGTGATRAQLDEHAAGRSADAWARLVDQGLHAVHLPEEVGGGGAGLAELAVIAEELGRALYPGPFLPTALAGAVLATSGAAVLGELAEGRTGALVVDDGLRATDTRDGWSVDGTTGPVLGLPGAEVVVVRAGTDSGELWFRLRGTDGITAQTGTDRTRSVGTLTLVGYRPSADDVLPTPPREAAGLAVTTLLAAEAVGLDRWLLDTVVDHVRGRQQFGRPIGSFQAVQHKAALMLVRAQTAEAAAWDAVRAEHAEPAQQALAAAQAALTGPASAVDLALDCVSLLGAIGFTWEHDAHLYWRRALSLAAVAGTEPAWAVRLGTLALEHRRDFSLVADDAAPALRAEIARVLDEASALPDDDGVMTGWGPVRGGRRRAVLAEAGLVAPHYPAPYGRSAGPEEQAVIAQEFARRGLPQPTTVIGEWVLPTLLEHGTDEQRERFVAPTLRGEIVWCQLFSEPGAGSDLAGISTRARRIENGWVLSGQKVWNSYAHEADWGVCLARTDPDAPRHSGLSYFLVDMRSAGVDVRPIRQATGRSEFNEVFLDDVFVPDECLVGEPGGGWRLAGTTLANERLNMGAAFGHGSADLVRRAIDEGAIGASREDALRVLGRCTSREMALSALTLRGILARMAGEDPGPAVSVQKVFNAIAQREGSRELVAVLGPAGAVDESEASYAVDHLGLPAVLFGGGTIEIQLNVIARRVLGLPGEPSAKDKGVS